MATEHCTRAWMLPPGLDATNGTATTPAATDATTASIPQAILDEVRKKLLKEVEAKVDEKLKEVFTKGNKMMKEAERESQQKTAKIQEELDQVRLKQEALKKEHEQLKAVLASLVQQLPQLNGIGGYFGGLAGPKVSSPTPHALAALAAVHAATNGTTATDTQADSSSASAASTIQDSPSEFSAPGFGSYPPLPAVPDFPFPSTPAVPTPTPSAATPLSLAEALGSETPTASVPVSLMGSLPPPSLGQKIFSFTLRKADGTDLGLNVSHHENDKALQVEGVRAEGAVEAWNRQCVGSTAAEKAVQPGDRIVSVNGVINDPIKMLEECRDKQLLKITIVRGEAAATQKTTALRADASEFVPAGSPASGGLDAIIEQPDIPAKDDAETGSAAEKASETTGL